MTDISFFGQPDNTDTPDAAAQRWNEMRENQHAFIDSFTGLSDAEKARRKADFDVTWKANLAASNLTPAVPKTPEQLADEMIEAQFGMSEMGDQLATTLETEIDRISALPPWDRHRLAADMVRHYGGEDAYQRVVAEAKAGMDGSVEWTPDMALSRHFLDVVSIYGRANLARAAALAARRS